MPFYFSAYEEAGMKLIDALCERKISRDAAEGILVFSKTPENWRLILKEMAIHPEFGENELQLFALALRETVDWADGK